MPDDLARSNSLPAGPSSREGTPPERDRVPARTVPAEQTPEHDEAAGTLTTTTAGAGPGWVVETVVSPFHCLYQDALHFHTQSRLAQSEADAARLARAALLLYVSSAEALVRQAAVELGRPELRGLLADPSRPLPLAEAWRLLPAIVADPGVPTRSFIPETAPWPQFAELLMLETSWVYPGPAGARRAYYRSTRRDGEYEPLEPHDVPPELNRTIRTETLCFPRTGLPRIPTPCGPGTSIRHGASSTPPSKPLTIAWAASSAMASDTAANPSASSIRPRTAAARDELLHSPVPESRLPVSPRALRSSNRSRISSSMSAGSDTVLAISSRSNLPKSFRSR